MEYFLLAIIAYLVIAAIYTAIKTAISKKRQRKLDEIAFEYFREFDSSREKEEIESIAARFGFVGKKQKLGSIGARHESSSYRCPRCGGMLVERSGKYGRFLGCNHYPKCRYTRNIQG